MTNEVQIMTANDARLAIYSLADMYSWETVGREMLSRMNGDEAMHFLADFKYLYSSSIVEDDEAE